MVSAKGGNVNVFPMDALTCSDHQSEGGTSKSLVKAPFVHWHLELHCAGVNLKKLQQTHWLLCISTGVSGEIWPPESSAPRTGRPSRTSGERTLLFNWPAVRRYRTGHSYSALVWKVHCSQTNSLYFQLFYMSHITSIFSSLQGLAVVLYLSAVGAKPGLGTRGRSAWPDSTFLAAKMRWDVYFSQSRSNSKDWGRQRKKKPQFYFTVSTSCLEHCWNQTLKAVLFLQQ